MRETMSQQSSGSSSLVATTVQKDFIDRLVPSDELERTQADLGQSLPRDPVTDANTGSISDKPGAYSEPTKMSKVLHVGCGAYGRDKLPPVFLAPTWREIRLDIDPRVKPDFTASITDMRVIGDGSVEAVYSSHNIEHLYPHEVPLALREMHRVLKSTGFALIMLPDLQEVARHVADGRLEDPLYMSPIGSISPLDIMFGHRPSLAHGNLFMAHRTGFTSQTLGSALVKAGFPAALIQRNPSAFFLAAVAFRGKPDDAQIAEAQARILPTLDLPAALYAVAS